MKKVYNRNNKNLEYEEQYGEKYLNFLYNTLLGRILLRGISSPIFSKISGLYNRTLFSKNKIKKFIQKYDIDLSQLEQQKYKSFNQFFIRKKKELIYEKNNKILISPAESKLLVYKITDDLTIKIKQSIYTLEELVGKNVDLNQYKDGNCFVFRISMDNYHRYCHIDDGKLKKVTNIKGKLHTVSSISEKYKTYSQNTRICNYIETKNFGNIFYIEIGALLVGKIKNNKKETFVKGEEKGYFELGGSTIVILTKNNITIDEDIIKYSEEGIETKVNYGERIGEIKCSKD